MSFKKFPVGSQVRIASNSTFNSKVGIVVCNFILPTVDGPRHWVDVQMDEGTWAFSEDELVKVGENAS